MPELIDYPNYPSTVRNIPVRHPTLNAIANALGSADQFARAPFGYTNPPVEMLSDFLGIPALQRTLSRVANDQPLTEGAGWTLKPRRDTSEALLAAGNLISPLSAIARGTGRGTLAGMNALMADAAPAGSIPIRRLKQAGAIRPNSNQWLSDKAKEKHNQSPTDELDSNNEYDPDHIEQLAARLHEEE